MTDEQDRAKDLAAEKAAKREQPSPEPHDNGTGSTPADPAAESTGLPPAGADPMDGTAPSG